LDVVLVDQHEVLGFEPAHDLLAARVVVVAGDVALGHFAADGGQPLGRERGERLVDSCLVPLLDGHVDVASGTHGAVQVGENRRPVLRSDVLHRVDGHDGVELADERQLLEPDVRQ
jgi:hypothetical protein